MGRIYGVLCNPFDNVCYLPLWCLVYVEDNSLLLLLVTPVVSCEIEGLFSNLVELPGMGVQHNFSAINPVFFSVCKFLAFCKEL